MKRILMVHVDIPDPEISIDGAAPRDGQVNQDQAEFYEIKLTKGDTVTFTPAALMKADLSIEPIPVSEANRILFGLSEKSTRLLGHTYYYTQQGGANR